MNKGKKLYGAWAKVHMADGTTKEAIFHFYAHRDVEFTEGGIDSIAQERAERRYKDATLLNCWRRV